MENILIEKAKEWQVELNLRLNYDIKIAVTQWTSDWMLFSKYKNYKARISYGANLNKNTIFYDYNFDLYFVYGNFEKEFLLSKKVNEDRIIKIGYPKLYYQVLNFFIKKDKPILTYLPTWDEYSAMDWLLDKLSKLTDYKIYIKPHPLTFTDPLKKHQLNFIKKYNFSILDSKVSTKSIVDFSDIIITDLKSGVTCDVLYFNPKQTLIVAYNKKDKNSYFDVFNEFDKSICEDDELTIINIHPKDKTHFKYRIFEKNYEFDKLKNLNICKISPTSNESEYNILQKRLKQVYRLQYIKDKD